MSLPNRSRRTVGAGDSGTYGVTQVVGEVGVDPLDAGQDSADGLADGGARTFGAVGKGPARSADRGSRGQFTAQPVVLVLRGGRLVVVAGCLPVLDPRGQLGDPLAVALHRRPVEDRLQARRHESLAAHHVEAGDEVDAGDLAAGIVE